MSSYILPRLQDGRVKSPSIDLLPTLVDHASSRNFQSRLKQPNQHVLPTKAPVKFPALSKRQQFTKCNQEEEEDDDDDCDRKIKRDNNHEEEEEEKRHDLSSSTLDSSRSSFYPKNNVKDKNQNYIKELEEKKRKEKQVRARQERRKKKRHEERTRKILEDANARQNQTITSPEVDDLMSEDLHENDSQEDGDADVRAAERRKEKVKQQKRLLKKQQAHLARLQAKQREEQEHLEMEKERDQRKREKVTKSVLHEIQDLSNRSAQEQSADDDEADSAKHKKQEVSNSCTRVHAEEQSEEMKQRAKEQRDAIHRKQQQYLQSLADQRKQKQREEDDGRILQEKRKQRIRKEAQQRLQEAAAKQRALAESREKKKAVTAADKTVLIGPPVDVEAMIARLSKLKERDVQIIPEARDFASWKKRHGVTPEQKVFCMTGWYPAIRDELEKRGWFYNQERTSPYFDFKWTLKSDELKAVKLEKHQYVNHFLQNAAITTKVGLIHNLRSAIWHQSVDIDAMFPRAYDLNDPMSMDNFVQDFRYGVAEGLVKQLARQGLQLKDKVAREVAMGANEALVDVVLDIVRKKIKSKRPDVDSSTKTDSESLEESVDNPLSTGVDEVVTDLQWEVLTNCSLNKPGRLRASLVYKKKVFTEDKEGGLGVTNEGGPSSHSMLSTSEKRLQRHTEKLHTDAFNREKARLNDLMAHVSPVHERTFDEAIRLTKELASLCPQFHINGGAAFLRCESFDPAAIESTSQNVWIVKPAGMSRGRGIRVFNNLNELLEYVDVENHKECQWIAQKYIENPLLLCKRKFDIRQWVLVTGWDPLTIWFNKDCYLRFSSEEYSMDDLSDQYVHLTNNSIQKHSEKFHDVYGTEDGEMQVTGNMWHSDDFKQFLSTKLDKSEIWDTQLHPRMKEIVVQSLQCVQDMVQHRNNSCELYGYDFMIDEKLKPWLIEVNSSPACDYSTPIAKRYVESGLSDLIKVVVDYREYEQKKRNGAKLKEPDTGCWQRIHKAEYIGKPVSSYAVEFQVKGSKMQRSRRRAKVGSKMVSSASAHSVDVSVAVSETDGRSADDDDSDACDGENLATSTLEEDRGPCLEIVDTNDEEGQESQEDQDDEVDNRERGSDDDDDGVGLLQVEHEGTADALSPSEQDEIDPLL